MNDQDLINKINSLSEEQQKHVQVFVEYLFYKYEKIKDESFIEDNIFESNLNTAADIEETYTVSKNKSK